MLGLILICPLGCAVLIAGVVAYGRATRVHVQVVFRQEGLGTGGATFQIFVNCRGNYGLHEPHEFGRVDLGWLARSDVVTVQARFGSGSVSLRYHLLVDGQPTKYYSAGEPGNQLTGRPSEWIVHRTYSASGRRLVNAGCRTAQHRPWVAAGSLAPPPGTWIDVLFEQASSALRAFQLLYYWGGIITLFAVVIFEALRTAVRKRELNPYVWLAAIVAGFLGVNRLVGVLQSPVEMVVLPVLAAVISGLVGVGCLHRDIRSLSDLVDRLASRIRATPSARNGSSAAE